MRSARSLAFVAAVIALAGAGCGGGSASSASEAVSSVVSNAAGTSGGGAQVIEIDVVSGTAFQFAKTSVTASPGSVTIKSKNPQAIPHGIAIEGNGVSETGAIVTSGGTSYVSVHLKPGTYTYYCPVPGHREAGMEGTLTVS